MPLYEYKCSSCGKHMEQLVPTSGDRVKYIPCPCGKKMEYVPSTFYTTPEGLVTEHPIFGTVLKNDTKNPWEGSALSDRGAPNKALYKSEKLQVDLGSKDS